MAPVGSYESLMAAIQGGAGSVYFGVEHLNMRSRSANNFSLDDLRKIVKIATKNNVKTYLTLNVEIFDGEIPLMHQVLQAAKDAGVSAVIAADVSVIQHARSIGLEVHISTQVNITNIEAVKFYSMFADVVVLAREMNLGRVWEISDHIKQRQCKRPVGRTGAARNVCTWSAVHGNQRKMLPQSARNELVGQPRLVPANLPSCLHRNRQGNRRRA
jgi:U32 family peptidase